MTSGSNKTPRLQNYRIIMSFQIEFEGNKTFNTLNAFNFRHFCQRRQFNFKAVPHVTVNVLL